MAKRLELTGVRFGRLLVVRYVGKSRWWCHCDCGAEKEVAATHLRRGEAVSCGCKKREWLLDRVTTHGLSGTPEHKKWLGMRDRCKNPNNSYYKNYGGRGIKVCERWDKFANFLEDMGKLPGPNLSLDRIDNDGDYEPGNCRWATRKEQQNNRRGLVKITYNGRTLGKAEWARELGMPLSTFRNRYDSGWSIERMLTESVRSGRRENKRPRIKQQETFGL